jgi:hypothetical protein
MPHQHAFLDTIGSEEVVMTAALATRERTTTCPGGCDRNHPTGRRCARRSGIASRQRSRRRCFRGMASLAP